MLYTTECIATFFLTSSLYYPKYSTLQLLPNRTPYLMFSKVFDI